MFAKTIPLALGAAVLFGAATAAQAVYVPPHPIGADEKRDQKVQERVQRQQVRQRGGRPVYEPIFAPLYKGWNSPAQKAKRAFD